MTLDVEKKIHEDYYWQKDDVDDDDDNDNDINDFATLKIYNEDTAERYRVVNWITENLVYVGSIPDKCLKRKHL